MFQLKEFQQHKDVSSSGASSQRTLQKSPLSVIDHNTANKTINENRIINENIKQNISISQVICVNLFFAVDVLQL